MDKGEKLFKKLCNTFGYGIENYTIQQRMQFIQLIRILNELGYVELKSVKKIVNILIKSNAEERDELNEQLVF
ncbi:MAG: hypothetical protein QXG18_02720 [Candidatus Pacearchaeota archaeon]